MLKTWFPPHWATLDKRTFSKIKGKHLNSFLFSFWHAFLKLYLYLSTVNFRVCDINKVKYKKTLLLLDLYTWFILSCTISSYSGLLGIV